MKIIKIQLLFILFIIKVNIVFAQSITISGFVRDYKTGENLIGASVYDNISQTGISANSYGFYSFKIKKGKNVKIIASYIGYQEMRKSFIAKKDTIINFTMISSNELEQVIVSAERKEYKKPELSALKISLKNIRQMPSLSGDPDVLKVFQLMPGVQTGQEGSSSLYVRGGTPDQNLYLIDDISLYYVNHLGGFVSIFDDNAINSVKLYKGGFPAHYGGRLSSVVDIRMKNGDFKKFHGEIKAGLISSKVFVEGPLKQNKTSFMFSARRSNIDLFTRPVSSFGDKGFSAAYTFFDIYGKIRYKISDKNSIFFSTYIGRDRISFKDKGDTNTSDPFEQLDKNRYESYFYTKWGNQTTAIRWNHLFGNKLFSKLIIYGSNFYLNSKREYLKKDSALNIIENVKGTYNSGISDLTIKYDFDYYLSNSHKIKFGLNGIKHFFKPGISNFYKKDNTINSDTTFGNKNIQTQEASVYIEDIITLTKNISFNIGLRETYFNSNDFEDFSFQPRFILSFSLFDNLFFKMGYSKMNQNLHLLSSNGTGMPSDIWLPASEKIKPEKSEQFVFNSTYLLPHKNFQLTIEAYYKEMNDLIDFKENTSYLKNNSDWINFVEYGGIGRTFGAEFLIQKKTGKITGWLSYTYSKNERKFDNINNGFYFLSTYDRPHNIAIVFNYEINKNITLSANWVFMSGFVMTFPLSNYQIELLETKDFNNELFNDYNDLYKKNNIAYYYGSKNNFRLPPYHRLDINILFKKQKKRGERIWQVGLYNAYFKKNIFFLYYKNNGKDLYKFTMFPMIPSVSYSFRF